jgi:hypothetical protein
MKKTLLLTAVFALSFLPLVASASNQWSASNMPSVWDPTVLQGPFVSCSGNVAELTNAGESSGLGPCSDLCDLVVTILADIYIAIAFVIWIILPISFVAGGIMYMLGGANPSLLEKAKSTLKGAVIGALIVLCAYLLVSTFVTFMKISNIGGFSTGANSVCTM